MVDSFGQIINKHVKNDDCLHHSDTISFWRIFLILHFQKWHWKKWYILFWIKPIHPMHRMGVIQKRWWWDWHLLLDTFFRYRDGTPLSEDWQIVPLSESSKDFSSKNKKKLFTFESLAILARVDSNHSGQYECHPDKLEAVSVNLHVVKGENQGYIW